MPWPLGANWPPRVTRSPDPKTSSKPCVGEERRTRRRPTAGWRCRSSRTSRRGRPCAARCRSSRRTTARCPRPAAGFMYRMSPLSHMASMIGAVSVRACSEASAWSITMSDMAATRSAPVSPTSVMPRSWPTAVTVAAPAQRGRSALSGPAYDCRQYAITCPPTSPGAPHHPPIPPDTRSTAPCPRTSPTRCPSAGSPSPASTRCPKGRWCRSTASARSWSPGTTASDLHVAGAICPHMGAHLGVGGRVTDGCLVCPFHEWAFGPDGTNVDIPYADKPNRKARLRVWHTAVGQRAPPGLVPPGPHRRAHLRGAPAGARGRHRDRTASTGWCAPSGRRSPRTASTWPTSSRSTAPARCRPSASRTFDGPFRQVQSDQTFSSSQGRPARPPQVPTASGRASACSEFSMFGHRSSWCRPRPPSTTSSCHPDGSPSTATAPTIADKIAPGFALEVERQFDQDIPIWENKEYLAVPALAPTEKPVMDFRKWASQFYAEV